MNLRLLCALFVTGAGLATAPAAEPRRASVATGPMVGFEVRVVTVPAELSPGPSRPKPDEGGVAFFSDEQLKALLVDVQADPRSNVLMTPEMVVASGAPGSRRVGFRREYTTGLDATLVNGQVVLVPKTAVVEFGNAIHLCGTVSADRRYVSVAARYTHTSLASETVPVVPVTTPVQAAGAGPAVPFTYFLQAPEVRTLSIEKDEMMVRAGGHAVITGPVTTVMDRTESRVPVLSDLPYAGRLFRSISYGKREVRTLLVVSVRVLDAELTAAPLPRAVAR